MENTKQFISWRRVSTQKQNKSGLGLEAQKDLIDYFVKAEGGNLIADYVEAHTGKDLEGCTELRKAIAHCKKIGATLIIGKSDRFRNTIEALQVYDEMEGNIYFCDLPHTDKFTLTLFFALAEREALLVSIRTKAALKAKKDRGEDWSGEYGKNTGTTRAAACKAANAASCKAKQEAAKNNENNIRFWKMCQTLHSMYGYPNKAADVQKYVDFLNSNGMTTATGMEYDVPRFRAMYKKCQNLFA